MRAELEYTWYYCSIESRTRNVPTQKKSGREKVEMAVQNVRGMPKKRLPAIADSAVWEKKRKSELNKVR